MAANSIGENLPQSTNEILRQRHIELANISRFRGELMGAAMLFIILFFQMFFGIFMFFLICGGTFRSF